MSISTMEQLGAIPVGESITIRENASSTGGAVWVRTDTGLSNASGVELPIHFFSGSVNEGQVVSGAAPAIEVGMWFDGISTGSQHLYLILGLEMENRPADNPLIWVADFHRENYSRRHRYSRADFGTMPLMNADRLPEWLTPALRSMTQMMHEQAMLVGVEQEARRQVDAEMNRMRNRPYPDLNVEQFVTDLNAVSESVDVEALDTVLSSHSVMTPRRCTWTAVVTGKAPIRPDFVQAGLSNYVNPTEQPPPIGWTVTFTDRLRVTERGCVCDRFDLDAYSGRLPANRTDVAVTVTCTSPRCVHKAAA